MRSSPSTRLTRFSAILGIACMFGAGCASATTLDSQAAAFVADYRDAVSENVADADRQQIAEATVDEMVEQFTRFRDGLRDIQTGMFDLNADYDTTREAFDAQLRQAEELRLGVGERLIELGLQLRRQTTADEWQRIHAEMSEYRAEGGD